MVHYPILIYLENNQIQSKLITTFYYLLPNDLGKYHYGKDNRRRMPCNQHI